MKTVEDGSCRVVERGSCVRHFGMLPGDVCVDSGREREGELGRENREKSEEMRLSAGPRLKEGCHINRSLLTLGAVTRELSKGRQGHVNYGDPKPNTLSLDFINYVEAEVSRLKQRLRQEVASASPAAVSGLPINDIPDLFTSTYSDVPLLDLQPKEILGLRWPE
ncbi:hypothetical protein VitviT2T_006775 [Vitis vinifera]|uniref:Kinesin motor domain-containing protein n=1 Tax=Vitis vinifera TaxID=29760 RepID=A0ABY9BX79_VITVI|nr:hypothetical protein VitviT2T_006775 [Vitis vinifera]